MPRPQRTKAPHPSVSQGVGAFVVAVTVGFEPILQPHSLGPDLQEQRKNEEASHICSHHPTMPRLRSVTAALPLRCGSPLSVERYAAVAAAEIVEVMADVVAAVVEAAEVLAAVKLLDVSESSLRRALARGRQLQLDVARATRVRDTRASSSSSSSSSDCRLPRTSFSSWRSSLVGRLEWPCHVKFLAHSHHVLFTQHKAHGIFL